MLHVAIISEGKNKVGSQWAQIQKFFAQHGETVVISPDLIHGEIKDMVKFKMCKAPIDFMEGGVLKYSTCLSGAILRSSEAYQFAGDKCRIVDLYRLNLMLNA